MSKLGTLKKVDLREIWKSESGDFTPWLAEEENIRLLGEAAGLELEVEAKEKSVGPFRADILCKNTLNDSWVLIENQLERTDHGHLGQLITYAAGLSAVNIIWIAETFTEEHRAAIDWLNEITDEKFNFFGLEIELWQIGDSSVAPKFNMVCKPNNWSKTILSITKGIGNGELSETRLFQLEYWTAFSEFLLKHSKLIKPQKPPPQHWANYAIGKSGFVLIAIVNKKDFRLEVHLVMNDNKAKVYFKELYKAKDEIGKEADMSFEWRELPENKESHVVVRLEDVNPENRNDWDKQHQWLKETLEMFFRVFSTRIKKLHANG